MTTYYSISIKTAPHDHWMMPSGWGPYDSRAAAEDALKQAESQWMAAKIVEHDGPVWAVLDMRGERNYGRIVSIHESRLRADLALEAETLRETLRQTAAGRRDILPHLMWTVAEVVGAVGDRVRV